MPLQEIEVSCYCLRSLWSYNTKNEQLFQRNVDYEDSQKRRVLQLVSV
jgi:hypothetical protein